MRRSAFQLKSSDPSRGARFGRRCEQKLGSLFASMGLPAPTCTRTAGKSELAARARCPRRSAVIQFCAVGDARGARSKALRRCYLGRCDGAARARGGWLHIECVGLWRVP
eukprot:scaffold89589_cov58-Phaeocystis_antarctica.AAC.1